MRHLKSLDSAIVQSVDRHGKRLGRVRTRRWLGASVGIFSLVISLTLAGCGAAKIPGGAKTTDPNPPFTNRLKDLPATPDPNFDPGQTQNAVYQHMTVYAADGSKVELDASKTPVLFVAYWCPHCQRTLVLMNQNRASLARFPVLVSMGFAKGTNLAQAVKLSRQELNYFHIQNVKEYFYLGADTQTLVPQGYPTLVFPNQGSISIMAGEHTLSAWKQALASNG